jgi:hypothetical protein
MLKLVALLMEITNTKITLTKTNNMKVNRVYKTVRPMKKFGNLIKDLFMPKQSNHFWIRVKEIAETQEEKEDQIYAIIELLNNRIDIKI